MNDMDLTTVITLTGPKANIVKMLNAGILSLGLSDIIQDGDDLESVVQKVTGDDMVFQFQDLLNGTGEPMPRVRVPLDEDGEDYYEDFGLKVAAVSETEKEYTVVLYYWAQDGSPSYYDLFTDEVYPRFIYNLVLQYGLEAEFVTGGEEFPKYASSFRLENAATGEVTQSRFEPFSEYRGYQMFLDNLTKLNRELFLQFEINSLKHLIDSLKNDLEDLKADSNRPDENPGATATAPAKGNEDKELPF